MQYHSTEFAQFIVKFDPTNNSGEWKHSLLPELSGTFEVIDKPMQEGFYVWELDYMEGMGYLPDEVAAVLTSWRVYVNMQDFLL